MRWTDVRGNPEALPGLRLKIEIGAGEYPTTAAAGDKLLSSLETGASLHNMMRCTIQVDQTCSACIIP